MTQNKNQFAILPIPTHKIQGQSQVEDNVGVDKKDTIRMSVDVPYELAEKIKNIAYDTGDAQNVIVLQAMEEFVKDRIIKSRPESLKIREQARRKRKRSSSKQ
jgi:hypothetical protein